MKKILTRCFFLVIFAVSTFAETQRRLILLIDHSASMKRPPTKSDPQDIRLDAATLIVEAGTPQDKILSIAFGDDARVIVPWTELAEEQKQKISDELWAPPKIKETGTDIIRALNLAAQQLLSVGSGSPLEVILLTDGKMEAFSKDPTTGELVPRYADLNKALEAALQPFIEGKVPVHCIALGAQADTEFLRSISRLTGGGFFTANSSKELLPIYLTIMVAARGLMSSPSERFVVWPNSKEITIVVFRPEPSRGEISIERILAGNKEYRPKDEKSYWSRNRSVGPRFYELVKIRDPLPGDWQIQLAKIRQNEIPQIHILQDIPFDLEITSPQGGKKLLGEDVCFEAIFKPDGRLSADQQQNILSNLNIRVDLKDPQNKISSLMLSRSEWRFVAQQGLDVIGDYIASFVGTYRDPFGGEWGLSRSRVFQMGMADFEIVLTSPASGESLSNPFANLILKGYVKKVNPACPLLDLSPGTVCWAELLSGNTQLLHRITFSYDNKPFEILFDSHEGPFLRPGPYSVRLSAQHPQVAIRPAFVPITVGPLPTCSMGEVKGFLSFHGATARVGDQARLTVGLRASPERTVSIGDNFGQWWKLLAVDLHVIATDRLGKVMDKHIMITNGPVLVEGLPFIFDVRASGIHRAEGKAFALMALEWKGEQVATTNVSLMLPSHELVVKPIETISIAPTQCTFSSALFPGTVITSSWINVTNTGEVEAKVTVGITDLVHAEDPEIALPRFCCQVISSSLRHGSRRVEETLHTSGSSQYSVVVRATPEVEGSELFPDGVYTGTLTIIHNKLAGCVTNSLPVALQKISERHHP